MKKIKRYWAYRLKKERPYPQKLEQRKYQNAWSFLLLCLLVLSCEVINPEEEIPAFLQVDNFELITNSSQGIAAEQITDVWIFVEDLSLGVYELPATVPVLDVGNQQITVFPVIRENGIRSTPVIYPLYQRYETTVELTPNRTVTLTPSTAFVSNAVFELIEEFEDNSHELRGGNSEAITVVDGSARLNFSGESLVAFTSSNLFLDLPISGGLPVFVEFDYQTNVELEVGLQGVDPNPNNSVNTTVYSVVLCPINRWNRVYVNLQELLQSSRLPGYRLAFRASTNDTGCGNVAADNPTVLLDNIKLIRLEN